MTVSPKKLRLLLAKVGCDIHERGVLTLMAAFRDAGMEVIYTGRYATPEDVAKMAVEESVDIIALSDHTGSMLLIAKDVMQALKKYSVDDIKVIAGGLIPQNHIPALEEMGVTGNFISGTPINNIINHVFEIVEH